MSCERSVRLLRRTLLQGGVGALALGFSGGGMAQDKIAQEMVLYQDHPSKDGQRCDQCVHFEPPNACKLVAGNISPEGWCGVFAPKA